MNSTSSLDEIGLKYMGQPNTHRYVGGDKTSAGQNFTKYYDKIFSHLRNDNIKFMEIGIFNGKSIAMWADYFANGTIYGVDINLKTFNNYSDTLKKDGAFNSKTLTYIIPAKLKNESTRFIPRNDIKIIECDTFSETFANMVHNDLGEFDVILDDGNHTAKYQYHNFDLLFDSLKPGGIYVIEDIENPTDLFSFNGFGFIINGVSNPKNLNIKDIKREHVNTQKHKNLQEYEKLEKKIDGITIALTKTTNENIIKKMIETKEKFEVKMNQHISIVQNIELMEQSFDTIIERKKHFIEMIDHIEIRQNNVIIYKK